MHFIRTKTPNNINAITFTNINAQFKTIFALGFTLGVCLWMQNTFANATSDIPPSTKQSFETAIFSAGCFWCAEEIFNKLEGVQEVTAGYTGGQSPNPTYQAVSSETTGHQESVKVKFNPKLITYGKLLDAYWHNIDPFDKNGQFCDKGDSYRAVIHYHPNQKDQAISSKQRYETILHSETSVELKPATTFYPAEEYHQHYAQKNPVRYHYYRYRCGRDARLEIIWKTQQN